MKYVAGSKKEDDNDENGPFSRFFLYYFVYYLK